MENDLRNNMDVSLKDLEIIKELGSGGFGRVQLVRLIGSD
jgi:hypothetical protein